MASFDFYEDSQNSHPHFPSFDFDLRGANNLLNKVQGLSINEVPEFTLLTQETRIRLCPVKAKQLVTPTPSCYYFLNNARPKNGVQVTYFGKSFAAHWGYENKSRQMKRERGGGNNGGELLETNSSEYL